MKDPDYLGGQALGDAIPADPSSGAEHSPILTVLATLLAELSDNAPPKRIQWRRSFGTPSITERQEVQKRGSSGSDVPSTGDQQGHELAQACQRHLRLEATIKRIAFPAALERLSCPISHTELAGCTCQPQ